MTIANDHFSEKKNILEVVVKKSFSDPQDLQNIKGIGKVIKDLLNTIGISTIDQLTHMSPEKLAEYKGFGIVSATKLIANTKGNFLFGIRHLCYT